MSPLLEVAALFTKLGFTAFGGPAVHTGMMEEEVVHRRKWIDRQHFLDLVSAINFIPGPNSTELAIHLGFIRAGFAGLVVAGFCFITPAVLIILPLAWMYTTYGQVPAVAGVMRGIGAVVIAVIAVAMLRLVKTALATPLHVAIAVVTVIAGFLLRDVRTLPAELALLIAAALIGAVAQHRRGKALSIALPMMPIAVSQAGGLWTMGLEFLRIGATLFGSGYLLVPYLQAGLVDRLALLTQQQMQDAVAIGQITPGPLLTSATFAGYVIGQTTLQGGVGLGIAGAVLATVAIFLPSFILVAIFAPVLPKLRSKPAARGALDGMNAAVVALIFLVLIKLAWENLRDWPAAFLCVVAAVLMFVWNVNSTWLILAAGLLGWLVY